MQHSLLSPLLSHASPALLHSTPYAHLHTAASGGGGGGFGPQQYLSPTQDIRQLDLAHPPESVDCTSSSRRHSHSHSVLGMGDTAISPLPPLPPAGVRGQGSAQEHSMFATQGSGHEGPDHGDAADLSQSGAVQMHAQFPSTQVMSPPQRSQQQGSTTLAAQPIGGGGMTQQQMLLYQHQLLLHHQQLQQQQVQQQQMHQQQQQAPQSGSKRKSAGGSRPGSIGEGRPSPTVPSSPNKSLGDPALKRQRQLSSEGFTSPAAVMATALSPQLSVMSSNSGGGSVALTTHQQLALQEQQQGAYLTPLLSALQGRTSLTSPYQRPSDEFSSAAAVTSPGSTVTPAAAAGLGSPPQSASAVQLQNQLVEQMRINQQLLAQQSQLLELRREQELMQHQQRMLMHQQQFEHQHQKTQQPQQQQQQQQQEQQGLPPELEQQQEQPQQPQPHPHSPHQEEQLQHPSAASWGLGDPSSDEHAQPELPPLTRRTSSLFDESPSPSAPTVPPPSVRRFTPSPSASPSAGPMDALGTPLLIQIHSRMGNGADHDGGAAAAAPSGEFLLAPAVSSLIGQSSSPLASPTSSLAGPGRIGNLGGPSVVAMGLGPGAGAGGSLAAASVAKIMCGAAGPMSPQSLPLASGPSTPSALAPGSGGGGGSGGGSGGGGGGGTDVAAATKSHTTPGRRPKAKEQHSALRVGSLRGGTTPKAKAHHHHAYPHSHAHPHQAHEQKEIEDADMAADAAPHSASNGETKSNKSHSKEAQQPPLKSEPTASADTDNAHGDEADMHADAESRGHHSAAAGVKGETHESAEGSATDDDDDDDDSDSSDSSNDEEQEEEEENSSEEEEEEYRSKGKRKPAPKGTKRPASKALKKPGLSRGTSSNSVVSSGHKSASGAKEGAKPKPKREKGVSCHQCKTRRVEAADLHHCGMTHAKRPPVPGGRQRRRKKERVCRKKYCTRCLDKFYGEEPPPKQPKQTAGSDAESSAEALSAIWTCPGCRGLCTCAACKRGYGKVQRMSPQDAAIAAAHMQLAQQRYKQHVAEREARQPSGGNGHGHGQQSKKGSASASSSTRASSPSQKSHSSNGGSGGGDKSSSHSSPAQHRAPVAGFAAFTSPSTGASGPGRPKPSVGLVVQARAPKLPPGQPPPQQQQQQGEREVLMASPVTPHSEAVAMVRKHGPSGGATAAVTHKTAAAGGGGKGKAAGGAGGKTKPRTHVSPASDSSKRRSPRRPSRRAKVGEEGGGEGAERALLATSLPGGDDAVAQELLLSPAMSAHRRDLRVAAADTSADGDAAAAAAHKQQQHQQQLHHSSRGDFSPSGLHSEASESASASGSMSSMFSSAVTSPATHYSTLQSTHVPLGITSPPTSFGSLQPLSHRAAPDDAGDSAFSAHSPMHRVRGLGSPSGPGSGWGSRRSSRVSSGLMHGSSSRRMSLGLGALGVQSHSNGHHGHEHGDADAHAACASSVTDGGAGNGVIYRPELL